MSFFDNLKNKMNIGGVSIELDAPDQAKKSDDFISGTFIMTTKSEHYVKGISVRLVERCTTTRRRGRRTNTSISISANTSTNTRTCGEYKISESFVITPGDTKEFSFELPFKAGVEWQDFNGGEIEIGGMKTDLLKSVGNLGSIIYNKKLDHHIKIVANVEGVWRSPAKSQRITLL